MADKKCKICWEPLVEFVHPDGDKHRSATACRLALKVHISELEQTVKAQREVLDAYPAGAEAMRAVVLKIATVSCLDGMCAPDWTQIGMCEMARDVLGLEAVNLVDLRS